VIITLKDPRPGMCTPLLDLHTMYTMDVHCHTWFVVGDMYGRRGLRASVDMWLSHGVAVSCVTARTWLSRGRIQRMQDLTQPQGDSGSRCFQSQAREGDWVSTPSLHFSMLVDG
jgi:hypothetical protein